MHRKIGKLFGGLLTALCVFFLPLTAWAEIVVLHTNDIHCGVAQNIHIAQLALGIPDLSIYAL